MENTLMLCEKKNCPVVSSRIVAEVFGRRHRDLVSTIESKIKYLTAKNITVHKFFIPSHFEHRGNIYKEYYMTKDGFSFIVMGFTGRDADKWKLKYIDAFNNMEGLIRERQSTEWLMTRKQGKLVRRSETDVLAQLATYATDQGSTNMEKNVYRIYTKLVNSLVGIQKGGRETAPFKTLSVIAFLEDMILNTVRQEMENGTYYKEIFRKCKANGETIMKFAYLPTQPSLPS